MGDDGQNAWPRDRNPTLGIGLPVHNGEDFLEEALDSLLNQTYEDFEIVVVDNASVDATRSICLEFADKDPRVRVVRNPSNIGGGPNFNRAFALSRGRYFKWMAHDDVCAPTYFERCVAALEADPTVVGAYPLALEIDATGKPIGRWAPRPALEDPSPSRRFEDLLRTQREPLPIFGVFRRGVLARTPLFGSFASSDRVLACELALHGPFREISEPLFWHREHPRRSVYVHGWRAKSVVWWDPAAVRRIAFPYLRFIRETRAALRRVPLSAQERRRCARVLGKWLTDDFNWLKVVHDFAVPLRPLMDRAWRRLRAGRGPMSPDEIFAPDSDTATSETPFTDRP